MYGWLGNSNSPYPLSSKMRKLPIIHVNVDLPVSGFAHVFFMQNTCKTRTKYKCAQAFVHWILTALCVEFSDFTQLQRSGCKEKRMQRGRQIWHLTVNLAILSMKSIELVIVGSDNSKGSLIHHICTQWNLIIKTLDITKPSYKRSFCWSQLFIFLCFFTLIQCKTWFNKVISMVQI